MYNYGLYIYNELTTEDHLAVHPNHSTAPPSDQDESSILSLWLDRYPEVIKLLSRWRSAFHNPRHLFIRHPADLMLD